METNIIAPIENEIKKKQQQNIRKRVTTARVVIFALAGFSILGSAMAVGKFGLSAASLMVEIVPPAVFIFLALYSYKRPYVCILIATIMMALSCAYAGYSFFKEPHDSVAEEIGFVTAQIVIILLMVRGTVNASKLTKPELPETE